MADSSYAEIWRTFTPATSRRVPPSVKRVTTRTNLGRWAKSASCSGRTSLRSSRRRIKEDRVRMDVPRSLQALGLPAGFVALVRGLILLDREPLFAVLAMLGGMALLLESLAKLCDERRAD